MRLHTGSLPYKCRECGDKFRTPAHRKTHESNHCKKILGIDAATVNNETTKVETHTDSEILEEVEPTEIAIPDPHVELMKETAPFDQVEEEEDKMATDEVKDLDEEVQ